ncbi:MAG: hypothetical protein JWP81_960 [Ferruginibacter sp.]|nr:hypothetical protein [Ferruginibacter sp.]
MKLPLHIAQKLQLLLEPGQLVSGSMMQHTAVTKMLDDGILHKKQLGKTRSQIYLADASVLSAYLHNQYGISDLLLYIEKQTGEELTRSGAVQISGDSKLKKIRSFSGFMTNVYEPLQCTMLGEPFILQPIPGSFTFINAYKNFTPAESVTIIGIENAENFANILKQQWLFGDLHPLFVCRYPQSNDLVKWLQQIPNQYLHFGDLDFEGINIYLNEFKKKLGDRSTFFIPPQTSEYLQSYGNRGLYNKQLSRAPLAKAVLEKGIERLLTLIHQYKKVLEQEIFIR